MTMPTDQPMLATPRALLFDLDGTLVDTVPDLAAALNRLMASRDLPPFSASESAGMVGDGVARLVEKAFAETTLAELVEDNKKRESLCAPGLEVLHVV